MADSVIRCPNCGYLFDETERADHITYAGKDGPKWDACPKCGLALLVTEKVVRTWATSEREVDV